MKIICTQVIKEEIKSIPFDSLNSGFLFGLILKLINSLIWLKPPPKDVGTWKKLALRVDFEKFEKTLASGAGSW